MVEHLNLTAKNQLLQGQALERLVENTRQREFDKLFDSIPVYDGEDPEKFEPWLSKLESACLVGKRDVREVAICSSTGPVLEVLNSIEDKEDWATHRDECDVVSLPTRQESMQLIYLVIFGVSMLMRIFDHLYISTPRCIVRLQD